MEPREDALERLYRERYGRFRDGLATVTGSYDTAHDVVQDAFAQALISMRGFRGEGSLEGWVWRIAFRLALRERKNDRTHETEGGIAPALVHAARDPDLAAAIQQLPDRKRLIVFLHYFADLSYAEIARTCSISEGTVAATLAQARTLLRQALQEEVHQ